MTTAIGECPVCGGKPGRTEGCPACDQHNQIRPERVFWCTTHSAFTAVTCSGPACRGQIRVQDAGTPCCDSHQAQGCCDEVDCGPCCQDCPTCPTTVRWKLNSIIPAEHPAQPRFPGWTVGPYQPVDPGQVKPCNGEACRGVPAPCTAHWWDHGRWYCPGVDH